MGHNKYKKKKNKRVQKQPVINNPEEPLMQNPEHAKPQSSKQIDEGVNGDIPPSPNQSRGSSSNCQHTSNSLIVDSDKRWFLSGLVGAAFVILILVFIALIYPGFRISKYYINEDPSLLTELLSSELSSADSANVSCAIKEESARRNEMIQDLLDQKVIVSSDVFVSNLSGYYNTLVAVLAAILIIINLVGFFSWRSSANVSLEQKRREMDDAIKNIDDTLEKNLEETFRKNLVVKEKLEAIVHELIEQGEQLDEEEWGKLHLLLKQYKRKELLEAIVADEQENDGIIEG